MTRATPPEAVAVAHFLLLNTLMDRVKRCASKKEKEDVGKPVRSRLREAPGIALSTGAASLITFYLSKSDRQMLGRLCTLFSRHTNVNTGEDAKRIVAEALGAEQDCNNDLEKRLREELTRGGSGYNTVLSMILAYLDSLGLCGGQGSPVCCTGDVVASTAAFAKSLFENPNRDSFVVQVLLPYLEAAKRLVDAIVKGEER